MLAFFSSRERLHKALITLSLCSFAFATTAPELEFAAVRHAHDGVYAMTMATAPFGSFGFNTRGFDGTVPGPTFRMDPGETLEITLTNTLSAANNMACTNNADFCESATTNLHTHGLHVSAKGREDGWNYYADDVFAEVLPGESEDFKFEIPDYHMPGTHWYHPHHHHATALQAGGGAAGVLIVNDPEGYLPEPYASMPERIMMLSAHNLATLQDMAQDANSNLLEDAVNVAEGNNLPTNVFLANGMLGPVMTMSSHTWYRFRMVFAAVEQSLHLAVGESTNGGTCTFNLLAKDGIYLHTFPREVTTIYLYPGARADVAVSCTCTTYPCQVTLTSSADNRRLQRGGGDGGQGPGQAGGQAADVDVMDLIIEETPNGNVAALPDTSVQRPCYLVDLTGVTVPNDQRGNLQLDGGDRAVRWNDDNNDLSMTYANVQSVAGGDKYAWPSITSFTVGTVRETTVGGIDAHPFHQHINPYQITTLDGGPYGGGYFQVGDWHDTLMIEEMDGNAVTVRMQIDKFAGKQVVHCHILEHEDEGMMAFIDLVGTEGAIWDGAEAIDATCLRSAFVSDGATAATQGTTLATDSSMSSTSSSSSATPQGGGTVEGVMSLGFNSGDAQAFVDDFANNSAGEAGMALQTGIAAGVDGIAAEDVAITGVELTSSRRLGRSLSAATVQVNYEITVPMELTAQDVTATLQSSTASAAITSSLNQELTSFTVAEVTMSAMIVTTTTVSTSTVTTASQAGPSLGWRFVPGLTSLLLCPLLQLM